MVKDFVIKSKTLNIMLIITFGMSVFFEKLQLLTCKKHNVLQNNVKNCSCT